MKDFFSQFSRHDTVDQEFDNIRIRLASPIKFGRGHTARLRSPRRLTTALQARARRPFLREAFWPDKRLRVSVWQVQALKTSRCGL